MRNLVWPLLLITAACAPNAPGGNSDDDDTMVGDPCSSAGATRCSGSEYQTCEDGTWHTSETCGAGETCYAGHGCAECDPSHVLVCQGNDVYECQGGELGDMVESCGMQTCSGGTCGGDPADDCGEATQVIYVVDKNNQLSSFDPRDDRNEFTPIGTLNCPAGASYPEVPGPPTPFSMSIDRSGRAWVLYSSGEIFLVDTSNASCQPSGYVKGSQGFELFGMGFVSDTAGSDAETLYLSGGDASLASNPFNSASDLGSVNPTSYATAKIAPIMAGNGQRSPELTGNGNGELWGYFPGTGFFATSAVARLDKATGQRIKTYDLPAEQGLIDAWAFAHYGGRYYIFIDSAQQRVLRLDPMGNNGAGKVDEIVPDSGRSIVGAGVSTCAPVVID